MKFQHGWLFACVVAVLSACGGGGGSALSNNGNSTAPAMAVEPQSNYNNNGAVDTNRVQGAINNYQAVGAAQVN